MGSAVTDSYAAVDSALLTIVGPAGFFTRTAQIPQHSFNNTARVYSEGYNVNFYLDGSELAVSGSYNFGVNLVLGNTSTYSANVNRTVVATRDVRFFAVLWGAPPTGDDLSAVQKVMATISRVYPVRRGVGPLDSNLTRGVRYGIAPGWTPIPSRYYGGTPRGPQVLCDSADDNAGFNYIADVMEDSRVAYNILRSQSGQPDRFDDSAGFIPWRLHPGPNNGCAYPGSYAFANVAGLGTHPVFGDISGAVSSQEVAHNFGLVSPHSPSYDGTNHSLNEYIDDPRAFNIAGRFALSETHTVMEKFCCTGIESDDSVLFEPVDFAPLRDGLRRLPSTGPLALGAVPQVFHFVGTLGITGTVTRLDSYLSTAAEPLTPLTSGPYYLVFLDPANHVLAADGFAVQFDSSHGGVTRATPIHLSRPMPAGATRVQIWKNQTPLAAYTLSAHAPLVSLSAPVGGVFTATQDVMITWSASDTDGDPLTFSLAYSRDDGATWQTIVAGLSGNSYVWNTGLAAGSAVGRIRLTAGDGFNSASAISNRFSVAGKAPVVSITTPQQASAYVEAQPVHFEGLGTDLEDGLLAPSSLLWASDRDGFLGSGEALSVTLSVGTHRFTLTGMDSALHVSSDVLTVTVESDFDGDGIPDVQEPDNFWNPDDAGTLSGGLTKVDRARGVSHPPSNVAGLLVTPLGIELTAERGNSSAPVSLLIQSTGLSELSWSAAKNQPWLSLSVASGTTLSSVDLSANASALSPGVYTDTLRIQAGAYTQTVAVTLTVTTRNPFIYLYLPLVTH